MLVKQLMPSNFDFYWLARIRSFSQRIGLANQQKLLLMRYGKPSLTVCNYAYNRIGAEAFPMISKSKDIHPPPFVLSFKRIGDLVSVMAGVHVSDPTTFLEPFGSPKYMLHMRSEGLLNLDSLIRLRKLESRATEGKELILGCFS